MKFIVVYYLKIIKILRSDWGCEPISQIIELKGNSMEEQYSVLMSVYYKEKAQYLEQSMESIWNQSCPTDNFVLVCDGELSKELEQVVAQQKQKYKDRLTVVSLQESVGLGKALNQGMKYCKHNIVARMDSDDISKPERIMKQLQAMKKHNVVIVGSAVEEFSGTTEQIMAVRKMPETSEEIRKFAAKRNPFNHPSIIYQKNVVEAVGGYLDCPFFEDYYLWGRILKAGYDGYNIDESLLYMRAGKDMYQRRGGLHYAKLAVSFRWKLHKMGVSRLQDFVISAGGQVLVCLIPNKLRAEFYRKFLRK